MPDLDLERSQEDGELKKVWYRFKHKKPDFQSPNLPFISSQNFFYKLIWKFHYTVHLK